MVRKTKEVEEVVICTHKDSKEEKADIGILVSLREER